MNFHPNLFPSLLGAYSQADTMEQKRVGYMVLVVLGMLGLFCGLTVIHFAFGMHAVHYSATSVP
jgi:fumarate reductase subunit D